MVTKLLWRFIVWAFQIRRCEIISLEMFDMKGFVYPVLGLIGSDDIAGSLMQVGPSPKSKIQDIQNCILQINSC